MIFKIFDLLMNEAPTSSLFHLSILFQNAKNNHALVDMVFFGNFL